MAEFLKKMINKIYPRDDLLLLQFRYWRYSVGIHASDLRAGDHFSFYDFWSFGAETINVDNLAAISAVLNSDYIFEADDYSDLFIVPAWKRLIYQIFSNIRFFVNMRN